MRGEMGFRRREVRAGIHSLIFSTAYARTSSAASYDCDDNMHAAQALAARFSSGANNKKLASTLSTADRVLCNTC